MYKYWYDILCVLYYNKFNVVFIIQLFVGSVDVNNTFAPLNEPVNPTFSVYPISNVE